LAPAAGAAISVDVDVTRFVPHRDSMRVMGEVIAGLVVQCRDAGVIDDAVLLRVVALTAGPRLGRDLGRAVELSAAALGAGLGAPAVALPSASPQTLTVVRLPKSGLRPSGQLAAGGLGVITVGLPVPTLVAATAGGGLGVGQRWLLHLGLTVHDPAAAPGAARALDALARALACPVPR
jgi:hypothetical protein